MVSRTLLQQHPQISHSELGKVCINIGTAIFKIFNVDSFWFLLIGPGFGQLAQTSFQPGPSTAFGGFGQPQPPTSFGFGPSSGSGFGFPGPSSGFNTQQNAAPFGIPGPSNATSQGMMFINACN